MRRTIMSRTDRAKKREASYRANNPNMSGAKPMKRNIMVKRNSSASNPIDAARNTMRENEG